MKRCIFFACALLVVAAGCSKASEADTTVTAGSTAVDPQLDNVEGVKHTAGQVGGPEVRTSAPTSDNIPAGGIVLSPANPDDPHYKPDPKMRGGG